MNAVNVLPGPCVIATSFQPTSSCEGSTAARSSALLRVTAWYCVFDISTPFMRRRVKQVSLVRDRLVREAVSADADELVCERAIARIGHGFVEKVA